MARIEAHPPRGFWVRLAYWFARKKLGRLPGPVTAMAHNAAVLRAVGGFEVAIGRAHACDVRLKELASVKVATLVGCRFCIDIGSSIARGHGVSEAELLDLPFYETSPRLSPLDKKVLDYAVAMTACPVVVPPELFAELKSALGDAGIVELTSTIAWENYRARFNHACGFEEEGYDGGVVCLLPPTGPHGHVPAAEVS